MKNLNIVKLVAGGICCAVAGSALDRVAQKILDGKGRIVDEVPKKDVDPEEFAED